MEEQETGNGGPIPQQSPIASHAKILSTRARFGVRCVGPIWGPIQGWKWPNASGKAPEQMCFVPIQSPDMSEKERTHAQISQS